jgi:hypothetical protein
MQHSREAVSTDAAQTHLPDAPGPPGPVRPLRLAGAAAVVVAAFVAIRSIVAHGVSGFPLAAPPSTAPGTRGLRVFSDGYDGQFVYRLALDPFTRAATAHGITLDNPAYRQQRIATALLSHVVAGIPGVSTALAIVLVNSVAVVVAVVAARYLTADSARPMVFAVILAVPACLPISLGRDLTEPVAWAGVLVALVMASHARRDRGGASWLWCALALTVAVLARETSLIVVGGLVLESLVLLVRRRPVEWGRALIAAPIAIELGWQIWVAHNWGTKLPILLGPDNNSGSPVVGVVKNFLTGLATGDVTSRGIGAVYLADRVVLVVVLAVAMWQLIRRQSEVSLAEGSAAVVATLVVITLHSWSTDAQFLRAGMEAWGLSVLVLIRSRSAWANRTLYLAGLLTLGVAVLYLVRL